MTDKRFDKLLEPSRIGRVLTRNRIIKPAAGLQFWIPGDNPVTEKAKWLFDAYARGGVGLIIMESPRVEKGKGKGYRLDNDKSIQAMSEVTRIIHGHGCPVFVQLTSMANWNLAHSPDHDTKAPSSVCVFSEMDNHNSMPREMTVLEIEEVIESFAVNAMGAQKAGFDGVEINSSCTHLLHTFLSPFWNKRQDAYGGGIENRTRLLVAIIREIKKRTGQDFPVTALINGIEVGRFIGVEPSECLSLNDSLQIGRIIQDAGADAIQVRSHWIGRRMFQKPSAAKRLYFDVIPRTVDDYLGFLETYPHQEWRERLGNPVWHIHSGAPPAAETLEHGADGQTTVSFAMLLNLAAVANSDNPAVLWGFLRRYAPSATPETHPRLDKLVHYAVAYFRDFVAPKKRYRPADAVERDALEAVSAKLAALAPQTTAEDIQHALYDIARPIPRYQDLDAKGATPERPGVSSAFFAMLYAVLLGEERGPRFGSFVALYGIDETRTLIAKALKGELVAA